MLSNFINQKFPFSLKENVPIRKVSFHYENDTDLLFLLKGKKNKEEDLYKAKMKGIPILSDEPLNGTIYVEKLKKYLTPFFLFFEEIHPEDFTFFAITGTSMKSSLAKLIFDMFTYNHLPSILISSSFYGENIVHTELTTPQGQEFVSILKQAKKNGIKNIIYEASSIGICEYRLEGINPDYLFLTNLFEDHLDYHKTIENYHRAKIEYMKKAKTVYIRDHVLQNFTEKSRIDVKEFPLIPYEDGTRILYQDRYFDLPNFLPIQARLLDYLLTFRPTLFSKLDFNHFSYPSGRLEILHKDPLLMLDYAHSPDAFLNALKTFSSLVKGKKILLFGAGGEREKEKRKMYGFFAKKYADIAIVSEDNSRNEKFTDIVHDIISVSPSFFQVIEDRKEGVKAAFSVLNKDDGILFLGKGNEECIFKNNQKYVYNEREEILKNFAIWKEKKGA